MRLSYLSYICVLFVGACAPMTQAPQVDGDMAMREAEIQREMVLTEEYKNLDHLLKVAQPIMIANAPICGDKVAAYTGATFASLDEAPRDFKNTMQRLYKTQKQPTVYQVTAGSPAFGKLKSGDVVHQIDGVKISSGMSGLQQIETQKTDNRDAQSSTFVVERDGKDVSVTVQPKRACQGQISVQNSQEPNAAADGKNIIVTTGMLNFVKNDNELALVLGHELAHNTRSHIESRQGNALVGMVFGAVVTGLTGVNVMGLGSDIGGSAFSQGFEAEADYVGLYHAARAGYDVSNAAHLWRRMGAANPASIHMTGASHPSSAQRFVAIEAGVKEIQKKKQNGQALIPQEKEAEAIKKEIGEFNQ